MLSEYLIIGEILKPQGVMGEVKVRPLTDDPKRFEGLEFAYRKQGDRYEKVALTLSRIHDGLVYLRLENVADRDAAEALRGELLYIDRANAAPLDEDAEFICDLIGCEAFDQYDNPIGTLREVLQPGANDVYRFETPNGMMLLPALKRVILSVDIRTKRMTLDAERMAEMAVWEV